MSYRTGETSIEVTNRPLIIKTSDYDGKVQADVLKDISIFQPEIKMYSQALRAMEEVLKGANCGDIFWPKLIYSSESPPVIILEDLRVENYSMIYQGVPLNDLDKITQRIAQFHALSMVVNETHPELIQSFTNDMITEKNRPMLNMLMRGLQILEDQTKSWEEFEEIHEKLKSNKGKFIDKIFEAHKSKRSCGYNVLNHGDFHIRNMLFKKGEDGSIEQVKFLDFQLCHWGSPALDLSWLIHINGDADVADNRDVVYWNYHEYFIAALRDFGFKGVIPTFDHLKKEILLCGAIGKRITGKVKLDTKQDFLFSEVLHGLCFMPFFLLDMEKVGFEKVNDPNTNYMIEVCRPIYERPEMVCKIKGFLIDFNSRHYLD